MDEARANNEPIEHPPTGTDQLAADNRPTGGDDKKAGEAPTGGDKTTEAELDADNAVEEDTLKALDPDDSPG